MELQLLNIFLVFITFVILKRDKFNEVNLTQLLNIDSIFFTSLVIK